MAETHQEIQIDFNGHIYDEKGHERYSLAAVDQFSKFPTACIFDKAKGPNVTNVLDMYIKKRTISFYSIGSSKMRCGTSSKKLFYKNHIYLIEAPVNDHIAVGLLERLLLTTCIKEDKLTTYSIHIKHALKIFFHQLRMCKQKTTKISPFAAHLGRKHNIFR